MNIAAERHATTTVSDAVERRVSIRAYTDEPVSKATIADILARAARSPSGGNLQPWRVYGLSGGPLRDFKARVAALGGSEEPEYDVYPANLWEPYRSRRFQNAEDLYSTIGVPREDKAARLRQLARNADFFGAPVGLFFCIHRKHGSPQWADLGMFMQSVMLLCVERGLDTCPQEYWALYPRTIAEFVGLPADYMVFAGMAVGHRNPDAPINSLRSRRDTADLWCNLRGWD